MIKFALGRNGNVTIKRGKRILGYLVPQSNGFRVIRESVPEEQTLKMTGEGARAAIDTLAITFEGAKQ